MALRKEEFYYEPEGHRQLMSKARSARRQRVTINLSSEIYSQIKAEAHQHDQSVSEYIENVFSQSFPSKIAAVQRPHPLTPEILESMMAARKQILQDTGEQLFEDSTELIRQMRLERSEELDQR
jgi:hypothetical protein